LLAGFRLEATKYPISNLELAEVALGIFAQRVKLMANVVTWLLTCDASVKAPNVEELGTIIICIQEEE
jgi:hypothetical protein